ncbi:hypothetical protein V1477_012666 [Vespula maculifrons]|uniref:Uncharacterized protein n=1 Tax=Vespula maculifrons TaxID=7453 RepID=A0ABD2BTQ1_VESMC
MKSSCKMKWYGGDIFPFVTTIKWYFDRYWFSLALNFDEYASQIPQHAFSASSNEESISGGDFPTREDSKVIYLPVTGSVVFWSSTRELRNFRGGRSLKLRSGDSRLGGTTQRRSFDILIQLPVQLCFGLRRENLEISAEAVRAIINEQTKVADCGVGIVGLEGRQQRRSFDILLQLPVQLCFGLRRENLEIFVEAVRAIINEQLPVQLCFGLRRENLEISAEAVRAIINEQLPVQLCFGLRRENLEISAEAGRAIINEQTKVAKWGWSAWRDDNKAGPLTYFYSYRFSCVLVFDERT